MMRVPADPDPSRLKADIGRLLRASGVWVRPGLRAMNAQPLYDLAPLASIAAVGLLLALGPLAWVALRNRGAVAAAPADGADAVPLASTWCCSAPSRA